MSSTAGRKLGRKGVTAAQKGAESKDVFTNAQNNSDRVLEDGFKKRKRKLTPP